MCVSLYTYVLKLHAQIPSGYAQHRLYTDRGVRNTVSNPVIIVYIVTRQASPQTTTLCTLLPDKPVPKQLHCVHCRQTSQSPNNYIVYIVARQASPQTTTLCIFSPDKPIPKQLHCVHCHQTSQSPNNYSVVNSLKGNIPSESGKKCFKDN